MGRQGDFETAWAASAGYGPGSRRQKNQDPHPGSLPKGEGERVGTVRYLRLFPKDAECAKELKKRTLTNLYNQRTTWLDLAHQKLDAAVFAAYGWPATLSGNELLTKLLTLNLELAK